MAKKPKVNPSAEFVKNSADIIKALLTSAYTPIAKLASMDAFYAAQDRLSTLLNIPDSQYTVDDFRPVLTAIGSTIKDVTASKEYINRFKKDANGYSFTFYKKATQGGELQLGSLIEVFPGAKLRGFRTNLSAEDKLSVLWAMMAAAGFNFTPSGETFEAYYTPEVIQKDSKSRGKLANREEVLLATGDISGIAGLVEVTSGYANYMHSQSIGNGSFTSTLKYIVSVSSFGADIIVNIEPRVEVSISSNLIPYMAETNDKSSVDYLVHAWMTNALDRSLARARSSTQNLPAVDLRITSTKLKDVARKFSVAKPRLNENGFCINNQGIPMYVPEVDNCEDFMRAHQNFSVDDEGYLKYEDVAVEWANKLVLVDWFNDVIVYTQVNGKLAVQRLLGYIPLDQASEYIYLNSPILDNRVKRTVLTNLPGVVDGITNADEAMAFLPEEYKTPASYNSGKITKTFSQLIGELARPLSARLNYADPDFQHETNGMSYLVKHMFGLDLEELPAYSRGVCAHISAYLKAASKNRRNVTMAIRDRLVGLEYFLIMPQKFTPAKWKEIKDVAIAERDRRRNAPRLLSEIDVPNLSVGEDGNLQGFMPHQVKVISDGEREPDSNITGVSAGGGKSLMQIVDILRKIEKHPSWRPLVTTKPGLIKNFISEVNFFTKGKVNVVSLRMSQLRYIGRTLKLASAESVIRWVKSFPPNTIFICAYTDFASSTKLYDDLQVPDRVLLHDVALPQFLHVLRIIGFDVIRFDESHMIKNMQSKRSRYAFSILAQAKNKALLSGTIISNTAVDLVGQAYGVNPMCFGADVDAFKEEWNLPKSGLIKRDEISIRLNARMKKFAQISSATKEDWAFVLPDLHERTLAPQLTNKQAKFYELLMHEAQLEVEAALSKKGGSTDEDETSETEGDDEDEGDGAVIAAAEASLAKVAQWLVAPDQNEQYLAWKENPSGEDLISPMVKAIDAELAKIYSDRGADHSNNKSMVFGIHKVASKHFMKFSKFKDLCLHYTAGDDDILRVFEADPDKYILVADGTSLREGKNMQYVSYMFSEETFWAPGDYEQIVSRMYRPDPKGKYNKDEVTYYWIAPVHKGMQPTFSTVKLARMISKAISMARLRYDGDPRWFEVSAHFEDLDLLKMNLETIFNSSHNDLAPYFNAWTKFVGWERRINQDNRVKLAKEIEAENPGVRLLENGRVIDRNLFTKMVMREAKSTTMLPGSKRVFTPWEPGAVPADIHDMSLSILGNDPIERGEYVVTEYGPGIVQGVTEGQLIVELYNRKRAKINKERIAIPNGEGIKKLTAIITNPSAWQSETYTKEIALFGSIDADASMAPKAGRSTGIRVKPSPVSAPIESTKPVIPPPPPRVGKINLESIKKKVAPPPVVEPEEEENLPIEEVYTYLINGMPALAIMDAPSGVENLGWRPISPFVAMSFDTWTTAEKFLESLARKFAIATSKLNVLEEEMDEFRTGRTMRLNKRVTNEQARNFFTANHRKLATANDGRERVDPYWVGIDKNVYLAFSRQSHSAKVFTWLTMMANKNKPRIKAPKNVPEMHINLFSTLTEAVTDLKALGQAFDIPEAQIRQELRELKEDVQAMRGTRAKPTAGRR